MGLLSRFEGKMEDTVEGAADRMAAAPLSPVQIAKKAEKQMRREKMVGAGKQYAPTLYTVLVNADDDRRLLGYYPTLAGETETYLSAKAAESGLVMDGQPLVRFIVDDDLRHAITKLSALHLTATEPYRRRVIQLGEQPSRVINTGAIGVYNIVHEPLMQKEELEESIGFKISEDTLLVTYHPATLDNEDSGRRCRALLAALDRFPASPVIITYPNNDAGSQAIIELIKDYAERNPHRVCLVKSLGKKRYLSALKYVGAVVGNSSSGIIEVPSMGIPTVDIGMRQKGRICAKSVIHCGDSQDEIYRAIAYALSPTGRAMASSASNPYYKASTLDLIVNAIVDTPLEKLQTKSFYDIDPA